MFLLPSFAPKNSSPKQPPPQKNGCLGFQGHLAVGPFFTASPKQGTSNPTTKRNPWHEKSASGTPPVFCMVFFVGFLLSQKAQRKFGFCPQRPFPKPLTFFLVAESRHPPLKPRMQKKPKPSWSGKRRWVSFYQGSSMRRQRRFFRSFFTVSLGFGPNLRVVVKILSKY